MDSPMPIVEILIAIGSIGAAIVLLGWGFLSQTTSFILDVLRANMARRRVFETDGPLSVGWRGDYPDARGNTWSHH